MSKEPAFWNEYIHKIPYCVELVNNFPAIKKEITDLIKNSNPFVDYPKYGGLYSNKWEAFPVSKFEGEYISSFKSNIEFDPEDITRFVRSQMPVLSSIMTPLEEQGHLRNSFISRLFPGSIIHPHRGWTQDYLRVHIGIQCDTSCTITVGNETQTWSEGKLLSFKDGGPYDHTVKHNGTRERIILATDLRITYVQNFIPEINWK